MCIGLLSCMIISLDVASLGYNMPITCFFTFVGESAIIFVSPLLYESGAYTKWMKKIIVVSWLVMS